MEARGHYGVALYKHAEFQQSREDREEMALKILVERKHALKFSSSNLN